MKIIDKIEQAVKVKEPFYSFEFFPPKTSAGVENLLSGNKLRLVDHDPTVLVVLVVYGTIRLIILTPEPI